mmetsp:Transcript_2594/g.8612  ORF Transcript_2594/g.8612 Transcript_2594/m.8612 type:complete len:266 (+) Transcript_2594:729-1526(+)
MHRRLADSGALILLMPLPRILPFFDLPRTYDCACVKIRGSPPVVLQVLHMTGKGSCPTKYLLSGRVSLRPGALSRGPKAFIEGQALNGHRGPRGVRATALQCAPKPVLAAPWACREGGLRAPRPRPQASKCTCASRSTSRSSPSCGRWSARRPRRSSAIARGVRKRPCSWRRRWCRCVGRRRRTGATATSLGPIHRDPSSRRSTTTYGSPSGPSSRACPGSRAPTSAARWRWCGFPTARCGCTRPWSSIRRCALRWPPSGQYATW